MKIVKFLMKTVLWIVALVLVVVLTIPLWISPVACCVANKVAPGITKTSFHLGSFNLNPYTGRLVIGDLQLGNPTNYTEKNAVDLTRLEVNVAMTSLFDQKIRVELVDIGALQVYAAFPKADNFLQIAENAKGEGAEKVEKVESVEKVEKVEGVEKAEKVEGAEKAGGEEKPAKGIQIDRLAIHDVTIKYGIIPIPFALTLTGLGADKENGMSPMEIYTMVKDAVMNTINGAADAALKFGKDAAKALNAAAGDATKAASDAAANATKAASDAAANATKAAGDAAANATKAVSGAASDATKAVGDAAGKATKAAGEAAGKALDSIKNLW